MSWLSWELVFSCTVQILYSTHLEGKLRNLQPRIICSVNWTFFLDFIHLLFRIHQNFIRAAANYYHYRIIHWAYVSCLGNAITIDQIIVRPSLETSDSSLFIEHTIQYDTYKNTETIEARMGEFGSRIALSLPLGKSSCFFSTIFLRGMKLFPHFSSHLSPP
jgi:hypothetical protein